MEMSGMEGHIFLSNLHGWCFERDEEARKAIATLAFINHAVERSFITDLLLFFALVGIIRVFTDDPGKRGTRNCVNK
jgi:hypothetical protein